MFNVTCISDEGQGAVIAGNEQGFLQTGGGFAVASFEKPFPLSLEEATASGRLRSTHPGAPGSDPAVGADSPCGLRQISHRRSLLYTKIQQFLLLSF